MFSDEQPTNVREEEAAFGIVRIRVGFGKFVMNSVIVMDITTMSVRIMFLQTLYQSAR